MDFWARQAEARTRSRWLVVLFLLAVAAVVLAVNVVVLSVFAAYDAGQPIVADSTWVGRHPRAVAVSTLAVLLVIGIASLYRTASLASGGGVVARSLGGSRVQASTTDPLERRLLNVVDEMAIASGVPVPAVYVLDQEEGINAFAAGHSPATAAIAVTRGALRNLERAELQGVVGHEFSHILHGDTRLNVRLMGLVFGLLVIALAGRTVAWHGPRGSSRRGGAGLLVVAGFAIMATGYVGVFFARLIQAAVSRQREFLADASSVQFTRDATGLRDALVRIGTVKGSRIRHADAEEIAHMLFAPGMTRWFATHPPLAARIRALDPAFDPASAGGLRLEVRPQPLGVVSVVTGDAMPRSFSDPAALEQSYLRLDAREVPGLVGNPGDPEIRRAGVLAASMPPAEPASAGFAHRALARLLALALDPAPQTRAMQIDVVRRMLGDDVASAAVADAGLVAGLPPDRRLPLLGREVPALRTLPIATRRRLLDCLAALARVDGRIAVFEYALGALARVYVAEGLATPRPPRERRLRSATAELQLLFSTLADHGHDEPAAKARAFGAGMARLGLALPFRPVPGWAPGMDRALRCLDGLVVADKAVLVEALAATVIHDGQVSVAEGELLRAACALVHCPLPPLVPRD